MHASVAQAFALARMQRNAYSPFGQFIEGGHVTLVSRTYWGGAPYNFKKKPDADVEPLILKAADFREFSGLYWTPKGMPKPRVAVVCMHPRVDFTRQGVQRRVFRPGQHRLRQWLRAAHRGFGARPLR